MIGIVVVSHSPALARAALALAGEMAPPEAVDAVWVAAGTTDGGLGTDAVAVAEAIAAADTAAGASGVVVLVDLGSAVLSAEMALEFLDADVAERVRISPAPLVEGLVAAVVSASTGGSLTQVVAEAEAGLRAKTEHLGGTEPDPGTPATAALSAEGAHLTVARAGTTGPVSTAEIPITGLHGLHARPAARLVRRLVDFPEARVTLTNPSAGRGPVDARSVTAVATLDAQQGHTLQVSASGPGSREALDAVRELAERQFGDALDPETSMRSGSENARATGTTEPPRPAAASDRTARGSGLQAAMGTSVRFGIVRAAGARDPVAVALAAYRPTGADAERARWRAAVARVTADLTRLRDYAQEALGAAEAEVFEAHLALVADPAFAEAVEKGVAGGRSAARVWAERVARVADRFEGLTEEYQRHRAEDLRNVGERVLRALLELPGPLAAQDSFLGRADDEGGRIVVVDELDPASAVGLDAERVLGVVTVGGGATGHGVLIARARGIPVLTGAGPRAAVPDGTVIAFDERSGLVEIDPDEETSARFEELLAQRGREREQAQAQAGHDATTRDGHRVWVKANVGSADDAAAAAAAGADGSGLVRTEVLFGSWTVAPTVAEQVELFGTVAGLFGDGPVTIRTWDVGADKPLPFLPMAPEDNPFLGVRGLRPFRAAPELLLDQLEAVSRVAAERPVRVMFPMIATAEELRWALEALRTAARRSGLADGPQGWPALLEVGIMVEVPAAVVRLAALSEDLDFVSIGSNDLTQYVMAADRANAAVADLADGADPAVLSLISSIARSVGEGVQVCLCGDLANDLALVPVLVGLGVDELSSSPSIVPLVKAAVRRFDLAQARDLADLALAADSASAVHALVSAPLLSSG